MVAAAAEEEVLELAGDIPFLLGGKDRGVCEVCSEGGEVTGEGARCELEVYEGVARHGWLWCRPGLEVLQDCGVEDRARVERGD